jgi:Ni,Fe-hydrogenase III small subunit
MTPSPLPIANQVDAAADAAAERLPRRVRQVLRRSLHIRHMDAGSCNGCDWEIQALLGPVYDIQRLGIDIVASPRHADLLLVTGAVTRHLEPALLATYEAMPEPRLVVAVGACACGGGVLQGSYAVAGGVDQRLPVDVYIPGCPPRPQALIQGLLVAVDRLAARLPLSHPHVAEQAV